MQAELDALPANGVHGWIDLDARGQVLDRNFEQGQHMMKKTNWNRSEYGPELPRAQLLVVDGGVAVHYIPELVLPRFDYGSSFLGGENSGALPNFLRFTKLHSLASFYEGFLQTHLADDGYSSGSDATSSEVVEWHRASRFVLSIVMLLYTYALRPILFRIVQLLVSLRGVQWLMRKCVFGFVVCLTGPCSKGRLTQAVGLSDALAEDEDLVTLDLNFLSDPRDTKVLHNAMATAHNLLDLSRQRAHVSHIEALPGLLFNYGRPRDYFLRYIGLFASTYFHASGTCSMYVEEQEREKEAKAASSQECEVSTPEMHVEGQPSPSKENETRNSAISQSETLEEAATFNIKGPLPAGQWLTRSFVC